MKRLALLWLLAPFALGAQMPAGSPLDSGTRLRLWSVDGTLRRSHMKLDGMIGDTLVAADAPFRRRTVRMPVGELARIERPVMRSVGQGAANGFKVGAVLGLVAGVGLGVGAMALPNCSANDGCSRFTPIIVLPPILTVMGAGSGVVIGTLFRGSNWRCVPDMPCNRT